MSRQLFLATGFAFATRRWLAVTAAAATIAAGAQIIPLTVFMTDSNRVEYSTQPSDPFRTRHSCMTSYAEGARLASDGSVNIYELAHYQPRKIGTLQVDRYHYPPPFLLLPQSLRLVTPEFGSFRALWFAMQLLIIIGGFVAAAIWIGGVAGATVLTGGALVLAMPGVVFRCSRGTSRFPPRRSPSRDLRCCSLDGWAPVRRWWRGRPRPRSSPASSSSTSRRHADGARSRGWPGPAWCCSG